MIVLFMGLFLKAGGVIQDDVDRYRRERRADRYADERAAYRRWQAEQYDADPDYRG